MTAYRLAGILVAGLFFLHGESAAAQSCPATNFTGTITVGDTSTPSPDTEFKLGGGHCCGIYEHNSRIGPGEISLNLPALSGFDIDASASMYLPEIRLASVSCTQDPVTQCVSCNPSQLSFALNAVLGSFDGTAKSLPSGVCGGQVYAAPYNFYANVDQSCTYDFARGLAAPRDTNHWAVYVARAPETTGPGYGTYTLTYGSTSQDATTWSSHSTPVNFCDVASGTEATDIRSRIKRWFRRLVGRGVAPKATGKCNGSSSCVGLPVDVASGNMYFDQADAEILGLGRLQFARSYNSDHRGITSALFGAGWFSTYEKRLEIQSSSLLKLRQEDGVAVYFADPQGDLRFDATLPLSRESWIVKQPDGTYVHSFREGGSESYDATGRLLTFTDEAGNVASLTYVGAELRTITAPSGRSLTLAYVGGHPSTLSGPAGLIATYTYDASNRLATVTYADTAASGYVFTYDTAPGAIATVADLSGKFIETHTYDGSGRAYTSEIAGGQEKYTFTYAANQTTVTDALNHVTTYDYVSVGGERRVSRIVGPCEGCGGTETQQFSYENWATTTTAPDGKVTTSNYDPATGDLLSEVETSGALTRTTTYTYDAAGHMKTVSAPDQGQVVYTPSPAGPTAIQDAINRVTNLTYTTPRGQLATVQNPRLKTTTFGYDGTTGDLTSVTDPLLLNPTRFGYDAMGRRNLITDPMNNTKSYLYDVQGRLTKITFQDTKFVTFAYDRGGRRITATDQLSRITTYGYDTYGRLHTVTDGNTPAGVTTYDYDAMSRLTTITDARSKQTILRYDGFGRVDRVTYPGTPSAVETFTYYPTGRLQTRTDRKGLTTTYTYDELGRLAQKSYSDGSPVVTLSYDLADRLTGASNAVDTLTWDPDLAGQVRSEASTANGSLVEYLYDGSGNRTTLKLNGSVVLGYEYDDDDRLTKITRGTANFGFTYDADARRTLLTFPNNTTATYGYDTKSRLTGIGTTGLDSHGHVVTLTNSTYTYDFADDRLTKGGDFAETYTYDPLYRLTQVKRGNQVSESYTYDKVGNRLSALNSSPWAYDDRNQLLSYPTVTFQYDIAGSATQKVDAAGTWTYEWDVDNQLKRVLKNGSEVARYAYDPLGRRVEKVAGGVTTTSLYDAEDILRQTVGNTATTYIHGPGIDEPLASENAAGVRTYLHADGLGSIVKTTNSSGAAVSTYKYKGFGLLESGAPAPYAFTGREWESETGLYYYRARYYDPRIGRFINADPLGFAAGINFYAYVGNNPVIWTDPKGERPPDYISVNVNVAIPTPFTGTLAGWSGQVTIDVYGNMYWAPAGATAGRSATALSGSVTAGWMRNTCGRPRERKMRQFLSGGSWNAGLGYWLGGGTTWNNNGSAWEVGIVTPQLGGGYHYAIPDPQFSEPSDLDPVIDW